MSLKILVQRFDGTELVDAFTFTSDDTRATFEQIGRALMGKSDLVEGCLCVDIEEDGNLNEDPHTVPPETVDWFLFTFLKMSRRIHRQLVGAWRKDHGATMEALNRG